MIFYYITIERSAKLRESSGKRDLRLSPGLDNFYQKVGVR